MILIQLPDVRPHHHVVNANLIHRTTLMTIVILSIVILAATLAAALAAVPQLIHPVVIIITMIAAAADPLVHTMTTTLDIMISPILQKHFLIVNLVSIVVLTALLSYMVTVWPNFPVSLMFKNLSVHPNTVTTLLQQLER